MTPTHAIARSMGDVSRCQIGGNQLRQGRSAKHPMRQTDEGARHADSAASHGRQTALDQHQRDKTGGS